jgi:hypothetical protein
VEEFVEVLPPQSICRKEFKEENEPEAFLNLSQFGRRMYYSE